jgi:hypothetical protein
VWVNNAGLDGATTYRHPILMEDYVVKLRPQVELFLPVSTAWAPVTLPRPRRSGVMT